MEFPLTSLTRGANSSGLATAAGNVRSLLSRRPDVAVPYVAVLGVAAVVGTLGNLAVISGVTVKQVRRRRDRATAGTDVISGVTVKQVRRRRHRTTAGTDGRHQRGDGEAGAQAAGPDHRWEVQRWERSRARFRRQSRAVRPHRRHAH